MSSVQYLRELISERLTAAAEEIFTVFEKTIVQYEEEVDRQRRLLDIVLKPEVKLHRIELPQQHVCKEEEVLTDQQLCNQERNSSLDQEEPKPPQTKVEQEEMCTSQEGEQLVLKLETETFVLTPDYEESDDREPEPVELPQQHVCKEEEVLTDQQLCNQERNSSLDQEEPKPPQTKVEQEEMCTSQEGEQLVLKQETETFMLTPDYEESEDREPEPVELPQQHVCKEEEVFTDQQLCNQERNSSLDQEDQKPPQTKVEQEEMCTSQEGEQLVLKQETETFMLTPDCEESDDREPEPVELPQQHVCKEEEVFTDQPLCNQERNSSLDQEEPKPPQTKVEQEEMCTSQEGEQLVLKQETETFMLTPNCEESDDREPEPVGEHQLLSQNSPVAESQDQHRRKHVDSGSTRNEETRAQKSLHENRSHDYSDNSPKSKIQSCTNTKERSFKCDTCGKSYGRKNRLKDHIKSHTSEKPFCQTCKKSFVNTRNLKVHMRTHTGERPYSCHLCEKRWVTKGDLKVHIRFHTGERPYSCKVCQRSFVTSSDLKVHTRIHTGERPYSCKVCQKSFVMSGDLKVHTRTHTGEKPYSCQTCVRRFVSNGHLKIHMRSHTDKPFPCKVCDKGFLNRRELKKHMKTHS
ncbi:zinc finger protein 583-like isoform X2 [Paralichthys olivaceus]|uniref:zinc finger protein 583-like isoform X2 n=1 Tax=Paralichthys olivaceus TaxID=8255 RepID=UPI00375052D9